MADVGKDFVLNPGTYKGGVVGVGMGLVNLGYRLYSGYQSSPFVEARRRAEDAGKYLAEILVGQFQGRFVNLVGFSLGTEVLVSCLRQLGLKNQLGMINSVVTMGGVADRASVTQILKQSQFGLSWCNL